MTGDYLRAGIGLVLTGGPLMLAAPGAGVTWVLGPLAILFFMFGARTFIRHQTAVEFDDLELRIRGFVRTRIAWSDLDRVKLSYYSIKRDRGSGWMQLTLRGGGRRLSLDSTLDGFPAIAERAHREAKRRNLELSDATLANFTALGIERPKVGSGA
jgi:hypothetical protein